MGVLALVSELIFVVLFGLALRDYLIRREPALRNVALMIGAIVLPILLDAAAGTFYRSTALEALSFAVFLVQHYLALRLAVRLGPNRQPLGAGAAHARLARRQLIEQLDRILGPSRL